MNDEIKSLTTTTVNEIEKEPTVIELSAKISELKQTKVLAIKNEETKTIAMNAKITCKDLRKEIDALRKQYGEPFRIMVESVNGFFKMMLTVVTDFEKIVDEKLQNYQARQPTAFANGKVEKGTVYMRDVVIIDSVNIKQLAEAVINGKAPESCLDYDLTSVKKAIEMGMKLPGVKYHTEKKPVGR